MNFKFTKIKTIVSSVVSVIIGFSLFVIFRGFSDVTYTIFDEFFTLIMGIMAGFGIAFFPIYLIWSLFEKKENKSFSNIPPIIAGVSILLYIIRQILNIS